ncbi:hypothetical protein D320_05021 [Haloferax sp. BAB-2207]|nr:hypothetical protein D320_05021 [Haloferax sp. BAB-2207]
MPEFFREWTGWQRLACVASVTVFVLGTLTFVFA